MKRELLKYIIPLLFLLCCQSGQDVSTNQNDPSLIIPGKSAEGYTMGEEPVTGGKDSTAIKDNPPPLSDILGITGMPQIPFDSFIYLKNRAVVLTRHNIITGIAGLNTERRVTDNAVKLSDGANNFILNYGNRGMEIIRDGNHRGYLYRKLGIAIFDDYGDDSIDMYLIFTPEK